MTQPAECPVCTSSRLECVFTWDSPPDGETRFRFFEERPYHREFWRCRTCGHWIASMDSDIEEIYAGEYMDTTYAGDRLERTYDKIMGLPAEASDNAQRVERIVRQVRGGSVLDVGSGLAVFPARMKEGGWAVTALDPDERAVRHARERVGVEAACGDYMTAEGLGRHDLVTFNKVLEHVDDPVAMLARARSNLLDGGTVYVEVPDGEAAGADGPGREEFFIEHLCCFSMGSLCLVAQQAGFAVERAERVREPSTKYTLYAFLR